MKKIVFVMVSILAFSITGCQFMAKDFGGSYTIELPAGQKLEEITWKDGDDLWYLTRPMTEDDIAETHTFQQSTNTGLFEGTVTIIESK